VKLSTVFRIEMFLDLLVLPHTASSDVNLAVQCAFPQMLSDVIVPLTPLFSATSHVVTIM